MKEETKAKKVVKPVLQASTPEVTTAPVATVSFGLRFLRKKNGSTILQEGVNDVWTDVPMVIEK